jgi:DNA-binding IclR family transcriptional regulator
MLHRMKQDTDNQNQFAYKSISRVAEIFTCLSDGVNTVTDIAQRCDMSKPTVSRLLKAMENSDLAIRDQVHRRYFLGPLLNRVMAKPQTAHLNLITLSMGEMNRLSDLCGETIVMGILIGIRNIRLHTIPCIYNIRVHDIDDDKSAVPHLQGSATRILMAQLDQKGLAIAANNIKTAYKSKNLAFDDKEFIIHVNRAREQGYAISRGERIADAMAVSAPIKSYAFATALSIVGIESRMEPQIDKLVSEVIASANRISNNILKIS